MTKSKKKTKLITTSALEVVVPKEDKPIRLDLGCGPNKNQAGDWTGVDRMKFPCVDVVLDLAQRMVDPDTGLVEFKAWPWADNSVDEVHSSHFVEHLEPDERIHFVNEIYRILKPGGKALLIAPYWSSQRAYGDLTHKWPPIAAFWFFYLSAEWRKTNAPHNTDYTCNFTPNWGYSLRQDVQSRNQEYQIFAVNNYVEVCEDVICTLTPIK